MHVESARELFVRRDTEPFEHDGVPGIRSGVQRGIHGRCGQRGDPSAVAPSGMTGEAAPPADLVQELGVAAAWAGLGFDLLKFELVA